MDQLLGDIVYFPSDTPELGLGFLYTARQTENTPFFAIAGSSAELYPPSRWATPSTSSRLWSERQLQRRWLLNTHPEAFMGNTYVQEFLKHDMEHLSNGAECDYGHALLCVGQMADLRLASNIKSMPFLAVATGDSGQQLRLARMDDSQWQWEDNDAVLHIPVPDPLAREDGALWTTDAVPITQIKAVMYVSPSSSFRWLLVQKATSTTILQPEYGSVLLPQPASLSDASLTFQPSFLNPNPLLTLSYDETGGNAHADVCFNPPLHGQPPRLALLDVCGYWTVWNISRTRNVKKPALRLSMYKCGHMCADFLGAIPSTPVYPADNHGMIHVGRSKDDEHRQPPRRREENCPGITVPSPYILLWNSHRCQAMDVESNGWLPMPDLFNGKEPSHGRILDVQRSCVNENHVFVLTTQKLIWLDLFDRDVSLRHQRKPVTLLSCSHVGTGNEDTKMCVGGSSADDANTSLVVTFSSKWEQLCVYWFRLVPPVGLPQWHRQITDLPGISEIPEGTAVRQLWIQPVKLTGVPQGSVTSMGSIYLKNGLELYQVIILGNDLSVRYCICTVSEDDGLKAALPTARIRWSDQRRRREWKNKRKRFLRQVSEAFVVPDAMDDDAMMSVLQWKDNNDESGLVTRTDNTQADRACAYQPARKPRPVPLNMGQISQALAEQFDLGVRWGAPGLPTRLTDSVYQILQSGQKAGSMPLTTWANIAEGLEDQAPNQTTDDELEDWAERLMSLNDGKTVVTRLKRQDGSGLSGSPLRLSDIKRHLSEFWLEPTKSRFSEEVQKIRKGWVSEIARDVMLSSHGVMVQDVPFIRPRGFEADQQRVYANQSPSLDHRIHNSSPPCSQTTKGTSSTDDAFQRLRLLAPSLEAGRLGKLKPPKVLSYWPTERGAEPASYVSSVAEARDEMFRDAKERLEEKLAKHKALVDRRLKRPAFMGQGSLMSEGPSQKVAMVPTMGIQSSPQAPPASLLSHDLTQTQGPGVTMSQPVEGAFGDLKNAKKKKRKPGFR